jgi:hypothetical protein
MSAAAIPLPAGFGVEWYKTPVDNNRYPAAARRVLGFLKRRTRQKQREFRQRDWEIARQVGDMEGDEKTGPCRRTIQRGLKWLEEHGFIERDWSDGHGRVIRFRMPFAGDGKDEAEARPKPKAAARPPAEAPPAPPAEPPPDADPPAAGEPVDVAEAIRRLTAQAKAEKAQAKAETKAACTSGPVRMGVNETVEDAARKLTAEEFRRLEAFESQGLISDIERRVLEVARRIRDS